MLDSSPALIDALVTGPFDINDKANARASRKRQPGTPSDYRKRPRPVRRLRAPGHRAGPIRRRHVRRQRRRLVRRHTRARRFSSAAGIAREHRIDAQHLGGQANSLDTGSPGMIRLCPNCNTERPVTEFFCEGTVDGHNCGWDLSSVDVTAQGLAPPHPLLPARRRPIRPAVTGIPTRREISSAASAASSSRRRPPPAPQPEPRPEPDPSPRRSKPLSTVGVFTTGSFHRAPFANVS